MKRKMKSKVFHVYTGFYCNFVGLSEITKIKNTLKKNQNQNAIKEGVLCFVHIAI